jgi:hypothetical protein
MCMIEKVTHEHFVKDVIHVKDVRQRTSPPLEAAPTHSTRSGSASQPVDANSGILKIKRGVFSMCHRTDHCMDALECRTNILMRNQTIIHDQRYDPLLSFLRSRSTHPSLTPTPHSLRLSWSSLAWAPFVYLLVSTATMMKMVSMVRRQRMMTKRISPTFLFRYFPFFWCLDARRGEDSYPSIISSFYSFSVCNGPIVALSVVMDGQVFYDLACKTIIMF